MSLESRQSLCNSDGLLDVLTLKLFPIVHFIVNYSVIFASNFVELQPITKSFKVYALYQNPWWQHLLFFENVILYEAGTILGTSIIGTFPCLKDNIKRVLLDLHNHTIKHMKQLSISKNWLYLLFLNNGATSEESEPINYSDLQSWYLYSMDNSNSKFFAHFMDIWNYKKLLYLTILSSAVI